MCIHYGVDFSRFQTNINEMQTCRVQEIQLDTPGSFCRLRCPYGWKKLVTYPRDLSLSILVIGGLQILDSNLILRLRW
jgi:hypothetical protein